jgi:hypothetical protein
MESYGSQDAMAAAMKEGGDFAAYLDEMSQFVDQDRAADWSNGLYKNVADASFGGERRRVHITRSARDFASWHGAHSSCRVVIRVVPSWVIGVT